MMKARHQAAIEKAVQWVIDGGPRELQGLEEFDSTGRDARSIGDELAIACGANPDRLAEFWTTRGLERSEVSDPEFMAVFLNAAKQALQTAS